MDGGDGDYGEVVGAPHGDAVGSCVGCCGIICCCQGGGESQGEDG